MFIEDGTGTGRKAKVSLTNDLHVRSTTVANLNHLNVDNGLVWSIPLDAVAPSGATWCLVIYNGGQATYILHRILICASVAGLWRISKISGTPIGGATITPVNLNIGSPSLMDSMTIQSGASITGLTEGGVMAIVQAPANVPTVLETEAGIVLPPGSVGVGLKAPGALSLSGFVSIYGYIE